MIRAQTRRWLACALLSLATLPALGAADPLDSARWGDMKHTFFPNQTVQFDDRVRVLAPLSAENPMEVPITVDASALPDILEVMVFAAEARLSFRVKLQQSTPVRAAALTKDGVWHVGGAWVNTAGGGCSAPSVGSASPLWQSKLNEVSGRLWEKDDGSRLRLRIIHPMDTGLAPEIPAFYIDTLDIKAADGTDLMRIHSFEPVAENPLFTLDVPAAMGALGKVHVIGRDNNGNKVDAWVEQ